MYEDCPSYKLFYTYDANGFLSGIRRIKSNGTTEDYGVLCNMFGDVVAIYYSDGYLAAKYVYDSWGKLISVTDNNGSDIMGDNDIWTQNSIRYRGYVYDEETKLYYLQSRYYDPDTCRFINADGLIAANNDFTINLYAYCGCNPISREDVNGYCWEDANGVVRHDNWEYIDGYNLNVDKSYVNHVDRTHITSSTEIIDGGILFGKVGFSKTVTQESLTPELFYSFTDLGNDANELGAGVNTFDWLGVEVGVSSEYHIFLKFQATPWVHAKATIGLDGIGAEIGLDADAISYDLKILGGWGTIISLVAPQYYGETQPVWRTKTA